MSPPKYAEMLHFTRKSPAAQQPQYWHMRTAPAACFVWMSRLVCIILQWDQRRSCSQSLSNEPFEQEAFNEHEECLDFFYHINSTEHVMTIIGYDASNPDSLHLHFRVDKWPLSIYADPTDFELFVNGKWKFWVLNRPSPGTSLEYATGGLLRAARYRVDKNGKRRPLHVMQIRLNSSQVIFSASIRKRRSVLDR